MKKVFSLALAAMLAICMAVPAFAEESDGATTVEVTKKEEPAATPAPEEPKEKLDNGLAVEGAVSTTSEPGEALVGTGNLGKVLQNVGVSVAANQTCSIAMMLNLHGNPGWYTFNVPTAGAADKVIILHWNSVSWEKVGEGYGNHVDAYFKSFSPVAVVVIKTNATTAAAAGAGALKAPQTGESMAIPFVAFAVIALAGVVAVKARKEEM